MHVVCDLPTNGSEKNICVYIHTYLYIHTYMCVSLCMYIYVYIYVMGVIVSLQNLFVEVLTQVP